MQEKIERDLKTAMLSGDKKEVEVLRGLKNALQYEAVSLGLKLEDLSEEQVQKVFAREAKKRREAAELYEKANEAERAKAENYEKSIIDKYLPQQLPEVEVAKLVQEEIDKLDSPTVKEMGQIIGNVKARVGGTADGALIARLAREKLPQ